MKENIIATTAGGIMGIITNLGHQAATTLFMGMVGALGGLIMKEIFNYIKRRTWQKQK